jgi:hypothetical protein
MSRSIDAVLRSIGVMGSASVRHGRSSRSNGMSGGEQRKWSSSVLESRYSDCEDAEVQGPTRVAVSTR